MSTSISNANAFASPADLILRKDVRLIGDLVLDTGVRATSGAIASDPTVLNHLKAASGILEAACLVGDRYLPADLVNLTGVSLEMLKSIVCELAFWTLTIRRRPETPMPAQTMWAYQQIELLNNGARIFSFQEQADAGVQSTGQMTDGDWQNLGLATDQACRVFGRRSKFTTPQNGGGGGCCCG
jgi:hypothetical protein